jgi:hypothetical protein
MNNMNSTNIERVPWHPNIPICLMLTWAIYTLDWCSCGGMAHVVVDDENLDIACINATLADCDKPENKDRPERHLVVALMKYMQEMTLKQRYLMYRFAEDTSDSITGFEESKCFELMWNDWYDLREDYINSTLLPALKEFCVRKGCLNELEEAVQTS